MNWLILKRLHQIFEEGKTKSNKILLNDWEIKHLLNDTKELFEHGDFIKKGRGFDEYYEKHRLENFKQYEKFLQKNNLEKPQTRFQEEDIKILMKIEEKVQKGELQQKIQQFEDEGLVNFISTEFFENDKYLRKRPSLLNVVLKLIKTCL